MSGRAYPATSARAKWAPDNLGSTNQRAREIAGVPRRRLRCRPEAAWAAPARPFTDDLGSTNKRTREIAGIERPEVVESLPDTDQLYR